MAQRITEHRLYQTWANMKTRCYNQKNPDYGNWGGRGVRVCNRWQNSHNFIADMGPSYTEGATLDRIDNNADYSPDNCRWVSRKTQNNNKRNNRVIEYRGRRLNLTQWAKEFGIKRSTLSMRYYKYNWSVDRLFSPTREVSR